MDTKLTDGDFDTGGSGIPQILTGSQELYQQIVLALTVRRGSFLYDKELGSQLYRLTAGASAEEQNQRALLYAAEAVRRLPQVQVLSAQVRFSNGGQAMTVLVQLRAGEQVVQVSV